MTSDTSTESDESGLKLMLLFAAVVLVAALETALGFVDLDVLGGLSSTGAAKFSFMVLHVLLGLGALGLALVGRLHLAVAALAVWALARWANALLLPIEGVTPVSGGSYVVQAYIQPLLATAALAAAWYKRYLGLAVAAIALMIFVDWGDMFLFTIAVLFVGI